MGHKTQPKSHPEPDQHKILLPSIKNKKFQLMLTRGAKAYSSSGSVVYLKIGVFTRS